MGPPATLYGLDLSPCEVLVLGLKLDGRPLTGLSGHIDWRIGGALSDLVRKGLVPPDAPLLLRAPPTLPSGRLLLWAQGDVTIDKLATCLKNLRVTSAGLCPADLGLDPTAVRAALGPQAILFSPSGEPADGP